MPGSYSKIAEGDLKWVSQTVVAESNRKNTVARNKIHCSIARPATTKGRTSTRSCVAPPILSRVSTTAVMITLGRPLLTAVYA